MIVERQNDARPQSFRTGNGPGASGSVAKGKVRYSSPRLLQLQWAKVAGRTASYRLVPLGTAWYRLGPDKFFLRAQAEPAPNIEEGEMFGLSRSFSLPFLGWAAWGRLRPLEKSSWLGVDG